MVHEPQARQVQLPDVVERLVQRDRPAAWQRAVRGARDTAGGRAAAMPCGDVEDGVDQHRDRCHRHRHGERAQRASAALRQRAPGEQQHRQRDPGEQRDERQLREHPGRDNRADRERAARAQPAAIGAQQHQEGHGRGQEQQVVALHAGGDELDHRLEGHGERADAPGPGRAGQQLAQEQEPGEHRESRHQRREQAHERQAREDFMRGREPVGDRRERVVQRRLVGGGAGATLAQRALANQRGVQRAVFGGGEDPAFVGVPDHLEEERVFKGRLLLRRVLPHRPLRRRLAGLGQVLRIAEMRDLVGDLEGRHHHPPDDGVNERDQKAGAPGARDAPPDAVHAPPRGARTPQVSSRRSSRAVATHTPSSASAAAPSVQSPKNDALPRPKRWLSVGSSCHQDSRPGRR